MEISNNNNMMSGGRIADHIKVEVGDDEFKCKKHKKSCNDDQGDQLIKHAKKKIKRRRKKEVVAIKVDKKEKQENDDVVVVAPKAQAATNYTDYVHVRARRGQATDSHSLAERARREKISQRMQHLQSLVPGCDKINGKALILDEIINYILSLQNQVEFLAAKLASVHLGMELQSDSNCTIGKRICTSLDPTTTTMPMAPSMLHESDSFQFGSAAASTTEILMTVPSSSDSFILQKPTTAEKSTIFPISMVMEDEDLQWDVEDEEEDQCMKTKMDSRNCWLDQLCSKYVL